MKRFPFATLVFSVIIWIIDFPIPYIQPYSITFFVLGALIVHYKIHFTDIDKFIPWWLVGSGYGVLLILDYVAKREFIPFHRIFVIVSVILFIKISKCVNVNKPIYRIVLPASYFIYLTHRFIYDAINAITPNMVGVYLLCYILKPMLTLLCILLIYYTMKRYMPSLLHLLTGN